jgi:GntR family transcriptional regulator
MRWSEGRLYRDLVPRDRLPPYLRIAAELRQKVTEGVWLPGEQVPSLDQLSADYSVSRVTARKAVQLLVGEGLLETRPAWGTFVADR